MRFCVRNSVQSRHRCFSPTNQCRRKPKIGSEMQKFARFPPLNRATISIQFVNKRHDQPRSLDCLLMVSSSALSPSVCVRTTVVSRDTFTIHKNHNTRLALRVLDVWLQGPSIVVNVKENNTFSITTVLSTG